MNLPEIVRRSKTINMKANPWRWSPRAARQTAFLVLSLALQGCKVFDYSESDLEHERQMLRKSDQPQFRRNSDDLRTGGGVNEFGPR